MDLPGVLLPNIHMPLAQIQQPFHILRLDHMPPPKNRPLELLADAGDVVAEGQPDRILYMDFSHHNSPHVPI